MFSRIATLWDIRSVDELDPVVKLLVESLASEVFRLSADMDTIEDRIVEKMARAFTPSFLMAASPAHGILHARAISGIITVDHEVEFVYKAPYFIQKFNLRKLALSPVCEINLAEGDVAALIADRRFWAVTPRGGKEHIANSRHSDPLFGHSVWIGLELGKGVKSLENIPFYFEFPFTDNSEEYIRLLGHTRWSLQGRELKTRVGIPEGRQKKQEVFGSYDPYLHLKEEIRKKYDNQFVTAEGAISITETNRAVIPEELQELFDDGFLSERSEKLVWLRVDFPPAFGQDILSTLVIHINCMPVANIYRKQSLTTVTPLSSIVPLEKEENEYFLFIDSVYDSEGKTYKEIKNHDDDAGLGTYVVRRGGSERFNSINARDFLERLLDLYRDESMSFASIDKDIAGTAENLMKYLSDFERKLNSYDNDDEQSSYIVLSGEIRQRTNLNVQYNMTNGAIANHIQVAERLSVPEICDINPSSAILMTTTRGGRKSPPESGRKDIYQYLLTSRDRIYTREDICLFCRCHYGDCFDEVEVRNGYEVSHTPRQGMIRVTQIVLHGANNKKAMEAKLLVRDLLAGLEHRSPEGMNYRIVLNE